MEVPRKQLDLRDDPSVLSPPRVTQPYACAKVVNVTVYVPQATLDVEVAGVVVVTGFAGESPAPFGALIPLPAALTPGQIVRARQNRPGAVSNWSPPVTTLDHTVEFPAGPPRPEIFPTPLYKCGVRTGVGNLLVGCNVRVTEDGVTAGSVAGANNPQGVNVSPAFDTGQKVRAFADLCGDPSPPSLEHLVQPPPLPLPAPGFDPIYEGATDIVVNTITNGARFTLSRNGIAGTTYPCWGGRCKVAVAPVAAADTFSATQELSVRRTARARPAAALFSPVPRFRRLKSARFRRATRLSS